MASFGATIRKIREESKKTMKDLAKALGVSIVYISDIELGHRNPPTGEKLDKMADFLGVSRDDITEWAARERGYVEIGVENGEAPLSNVALALARRGESLTEEEASQILKIINKGHRND